MIAQLKPSADLGELQQEIVKFIGRRSKTRKQIMRQLLKTWDRETSDIAISSAIRNQLILPDLKSSTVDVGYRVPSIVGSPVMQSEPVEQPQRPASTPNKIERWAKAQIKKGGERDAYSWLIAYSRTFKGWGCRTPIEWVTAQFECKTDALIELQQQLQKLYQQKAESKDWQEIKRLNTKITRLRKVTSLYRRNLDRLRYILSLH